MRLIDADALIPLIQEDKIEGGTLDTIKALGAGLQAETLNQACDRHIKIINSLPIIEVESVKCGQWKPFDLTWGRSIYACTSCGEAFEVPTEGDKPMYDYCPYCGARMMDGGRND